MSKGHTIKASSLAAASSSSSPSSSSSSSFARSVADIRDHGLPTLSVLSSPDKLIVERFFSGYEVRHHATIGRSKGFGQVNLGDSWRRKERRTHRFIQL